MNGALRYDVVVIGAGTAGLVAGTRLAQAGASVCVLAKGFGSTHLAPGTIDVLGYAPQPIDSPLEALGELAAAQPGHPYALIGADVVSSALAWFRGTADSGPYPGYGYVCAGSGSGSGGCGGGENAGAERNMLLPTALGALRPSLLVPVTMAAGNRERLGRVCIAGTPSLRDFHPSLCAANLAATGIEARAVNIELELERADMSTLGIARQMDDERWRAQFCALLSPLLHAEEQVGLPAMLGLREPRIVFEDVQERLGRAVFEIPALPPSVPGMRLYEILSSALRAAGGRLVLGAEVSSHERSGERLSSVSTHSAGHDSHYEARWFVLASGGFASGGIELDSHWATHERVLGLPLRGVPAAHEPRFVPGYLDEQPLARAGVAVDRELRAEGTENVFVAGACLPGAVPWREGSGEGLALSSGFKVASVITAAIGTATEVPA